MLNTKFFRENIYPKNSKVDSGLDLQLIFLSTPWKEDITYRLVSDDGRLITNLDGPFVKPIAMHIGHKCQLIGIFYENKKTIYEFMFMEG